MDLDDASPALRGLGGVNGPPTAPVTEVIANFRPTKLFNREDIEDNKSNPYILSIDFDDPGELCMTSESDRTIQIYNVKEGRHDKMLISKKYGVKLAKFTHTSSSVIYASTRENGGNHRRQTTQWLLTSENRRDQISRNPRQLLHPLL